MEQWLKDMPNCKRILSIDRESQSAELQIRSVDGYARGFSDRSKDLIEQKLNPDDLRAKGYCLI